MNIPVIKVTGKNLPEAWEKSLIETWNNGCQIKTQYDKPEDPPSRDCTIIMEIEDPISEPRIHLDFPGGPEDLQEYTMEVTEGIKDHWIRDPNDPNDTRWEYTYSQRIFKYSYPNGNPIDQIELLSDKLAKSPHTRQAQAITWKVWEDNTIYDPACMQSLFFRLMPDGDSYSLNMNVRFRSNDAYKAAFMNIFALIQLQQIVADKISSKSDMKIKLGRYCHMADSYHIYGSYFNEFKDRFLNNLESRSFEDRTANYIEDWKEMMDESRQDILDKVKDFDNR